VLKRIKSKNKIFPVWGFMAASFMLLGILGVITALNFNREGKLMKQHYLHEGLTLISMLESSVRIGVTELKWGEKQVQKLLEESAKGPNIEYIIVVYKSGKVLANSRGLPVGKNISNFRLPTTRTPVITKVIEEVNDNNIFQLTKKCQAFLGVNLTPELSSPDSKSLDFSTRDHYIILGLNMAEFEEAQLEDVRLALISAAILLILGSGTFYFLLLMQNYISVRATLKHMETYTQNVVESMPNGLISLDREGHIETFNHNAARLLGVHPGSVKGKLINEVLPSCDLKKVLNLTSDILEEQMECHRNDGRIVPVSLTASHLKDEDGNDKGTVLILRDLREIKTLEKEIERSERLASLGRMAAGIAHEIRNPLSSIKGFAQYFRNKFAPQSEDWNYAVMMAKEVDRLNRVIQELLSFARPQEPNLQFVEIYPLIQHALKLIQSDLREKQIDVKVNQAGTQALFALTDSDMLIQVFLNLFINSMEAMKEKGQLTIAVTEQQNHIVIEICDTGSGITSEHVSRIFDPFYTTKKGGTGLGLAIVYRLIEQMQGEIEVNSQINHGATFIVRLRKKTQQ